ncbi:hypothetical protein WICPIJ_003347 [Wickerhamomyces pijperi]|uniref:Uncharacterized protein n=1 Tax=Wickerhamomyces pijperi TaxID=599730 RepID=A0A9P8Q7T0_WICPI|nr:hypothetical protein WICPIJ_003347 [Wickerhamomyces pijperi]
MNRLHALRAVGRSQNVNLKLAIPRSLQTISHSSDYVPTAVPVSYLDLVSSQQSTRITNERMMSNKHEPFLTHNNTCLRFFRNTHTLQSSQEPQEDSNLTRKANFGSMVTYLKDDLTPNLLTELPNSSKLDASIILKLSESLVNLDIITNHFPDALNIHGRVSYQTIIKAIQLFLKGFYLHDGYDHKLLVTHTEVDPHGTTHHQYGIIKGAPKIIIHWKLAHKPIISPSGGSTGRTNGIEIPDLNEFEEGFSGVFCFELNEDCDRILVHNVENVLILGNRNLRGEGFDGFVRA